MQKIRNFRIRMAALYLKAKKPHITRLRAEEKQMDEHTAKLAAQKERIRGLVGTIKRKRRRNASERANQVSSRADRLLKRMLEARQGKRRRIELIKKTARVISGKKKKP